MQMPAYAQVLHGGAYSLSFAKFPQSFVRYETDAVVRWTDGLEWSPERLTERDLDYFDFVLAVGDRWAHERLQTKFPGFSPSPATTTLPGGCTALAPTPGTRSSSVSIPDDTTGNTWGPARCCLLVLFLPPTRRRLEAFGIVGALDEVESRQGRRGFLQNLLGDFDIGEQFVEVQVRRARPVQGRHGHDVVVDQAEPVFNRLKLGSTRRTLRSISSKVLRRRRRTSRLCSSRGRVAASAVVIWRSIWMIWF